MREVEDGWYEDQLEERVQSLEDFVKEFLETQPPDVVAQAVVFAAKRGLSDVLSLDWADMTLSESDGQPAQLARAYVTIEQTGMLEGCPEDLGTVADVLYRHVEEGRLAFDPNATWTGSCRGVPPGVEVDPGQHLLDWVRSLLGRPVPPDWSNDESHFLWDELPRWLSAIVDTCDPGSAALGLEAMQLLRQADMNWYNDSHILGPYDQVAALAQRD